VAQTFKRVHRDASFRVLGGSRGKSLRWAHSRKRQTATATPAEPGASLRASHGRSCRSSPALATFPSPQQTVAPPETSIKLGCASGPLAQLSDEPLSPQHPPSQREGIYRNAGGSVVVRSHHCHVRERLLPGVLGPSCTDESGGVLRTEGVLQMDGTSSHTVASPKSSNLLIRLTWTDIQATLGVAPRLRTAVGIRGAQWQRPHPHQVQVGPIPSPNHGRPACGRCWWMAGAVRRTASISPGTRPEMRRLR
jgi:hypothetical protein